MKAAILNQYGESPKYVDLTAPVPNADEVIVEMVASSIKQVDKLKAAGKHYTKYPNLPAVVGMDGIARLSNGSYVYVSGISGTMAEMALVVPNNWVSVPQNLPIPLAAALPNALMGSDAAMLYRGKFQEGHTVVINGATGGTGRIAVQMAKNRGANCVIAIGRISSGLSELTNLGADIVINTEQTEAAYLNELSGYLSKHQPDLVIDYLWSRPAELLLKVLNEVMKKEVRFVTVGEMAGATINLPSALLRSRKILLLGSGIGSISFTEIKQYLATELPRVYKWAEEGKIIMPIQTVELAQIETAWQRPEEKGKRMVVLIQP